jgi:hypothetical protein
MGLDVGGYTDRPDWPKMGPSLLIATSLIVAIRTAKWPAHVDKAVSSPDLDREIDFAAHVAGRVPMRLLQQCQAIFPQRKEPWYQPDGEDQPKQNSPMCGRYYRRSDKQKIAEAFRTGLPTTFEILPSFNVAPQSFQPIVRRSKETDDREIVQMRWGLVPFWSKDAKIAYSTINAKAETVARSALFREAFKRRRCLVESINLLQ